MLEQLSQLFEFLWGGPLFLRKGSIKNGIPWQDYMRLH